LASGLIRRTPKGGTSAPPLITADDEGALEAADKIQLLSS